MTGRGTHDGIAEAWRRIEVWLRDNHPQGDTMLAPGLPDAKLAALEKGLGFPVPAALQASLRIHDGELEFEGAAFGLFNECFLLSAAHILRDWQINRDVSAAWSSEENRALDVIDGVRPRLWSRGWIPVAHNGCGDYYCVDTDPDTGGTIGQVIFVSHEVGPEHRAAVGMEEWLREYADRLEAGGMRITEGGTLSE